MATAIHGLALPEISVENFEHSWTRFEFTAAANKWDNGRDLVILPALLRGKLQDFYTTLSDDEKKDLAALKRALSDRAGLTKDPLASAKKFTEKKQDAKESVRYFEADLRKLFSEAYPGEDASKSSVLLGRFVTGLLPEITRQMLLRGSPTTMEGAVKSAIEIERAFGFQTVETQHVQALRVEETPVKGHGQKSELELQEKLDQVLRDSDQDAERQQTIAVIAATEKATFNVTVLLQGGVNGEQEMTRKLMNQAAGTANGVRHHSRYVAVILVTPRCVHAGCSGVDRFTF